MWHRSISEIRYRTISSYVIAACGIVLLTGCGAQDRVDRPLAPPRPPISKNPDNLRDLYLQGQFTDSQGNRWDIAFLPGIQPILADASASYTRAGGYLRRFDTGGFLFDDEDTRKETETVKGWLTFAGPTVIGDYMVAGINRDYHSTTSNLSALVNERPPAWMIWVGVQTISGYVLKPIGRVVTGIPASLVAGFYGTAIAVGDGTVRTTLAASDIAVLGMIYPAGRLLWHHPTWIVWSAMPEPKLEYDGTAGLRIVARPENTPAAAKTSEMH